MDRCALFVDAGYVLADGAMAVHGTRHRESVSWNYAGLLQFLGSVARDRTGLPLLRCYWYEATVEGRRSAEHDALADLPGVKLRLGRMRPGRREGVESEIHRDLTTLARNGALQDALVVSAEEDLAQVIADVQDLGLRVTLVHITVDGNWTISRALRQECDDIVEIGEAHLRPYVELVVGAEPLHDDERQGVGAYPGRALTNGHGPVGPLGHQQALPAGSSPAPPEIYTAPVIAEYQRTAQPAMNGQPGAQQPTSPSGPIGMAPPEQQAPQPRRSRNARRLRPRTCRRARRPCLACSSRRAWRPSRPLPPASPLCRPASPHLRRVRRPRPPGPCRRSRAWRSPPPHPGWPASRPPSSRQLRSSRCRPRASGGAATPAPARVPPACRPHPTPGSSPPRRHQWASRRCPASSRCPASRWYPASRLAARPAGDARPARPASGGRASR